MTTKNDTYAHRVLNLTCILQNLTEFVENLPAPDDEDGLPANFDYSHLGSLGHLQNLLAEASLVTDSFSE